MDRIRYHMDDTGGAPMLVVSSTDVDAALAEFRERRLNHEAARKYTITDDDGNEHNAGMWRDNMHDVLEELSDAHNIANICLKRVIAGQISDPDLLMPLCELITQTEQLMLKALAVRELLPLEFQQDVYEVLGDKTPNRIVTLEDVGL